MSYSPWPVLWGALIMDFFFFFFFFSSSISYSKLLSDKIVSPFDRGASLLQYSCKFMCRTSRMYLSPNRGVKWPFFSSIKLRYQNRAPTPDSDPYRNLHVSAAQCRLLKASAVTILPLSGTLIFNLNNEL